MERSYKGVLESEGPVVLLNPADNNHYFEIFRLTTSLSRTGSTEFSSRPVLISGWYYDCHDYPD